jgi:hypothetical protein
LNTARQDARQMIIFQEIFAALFQIPLPLPFPPIQLPSSG